MKNLALKLFTLFLSFQLVSCSENTEATNNDNISETELKEEINIEEINTKGLRPISLSENEIDITILVPEKYYTDEEDLPRFTPPEIKHNNGEATWEIKVPGDKHWHLVIEDWGKAKRYIDTLKDQHSYNKEIFDYIYHKETEEYIIYSQILKADNTTLDDKEIEMLPNYHFYAIRNINGNTIVFKSHEMVNYRKPTIEKMLASARMAQ